MSGSMYLGAVHRSETFLGAIAEAGLPAPRVSGLGDIQVAHVRREIRP